MTVILVFEAIRTWLSDMVSSNLSAIETYKVLFQLQSGFLILIVVRYQDRKRLDESKKKKHTIQDKRCLEFCRHNDELGGRHLRVEDLLEACR